MGLANTAPAVTHWNLSITVWAFRSRSLPDLRLGLLAQEVGLQSRLPAARSISSRPRIAAIRSLQAADVRLFGLENRLHRCRRCFLSSDGVGRGEAEMATTSSAATIPASRWRSLSRIASRSVSEEPVLLVQDTTIERLPWRARADIGSYSDRTRSWSTTNRSRSARAARSRASASPAAPSTDLGEARRVGQGDRPSDPFHYGLGEGLAAPGRAHHRLGLADVLTRAGR